MLLRTQNETQNKRYASLGVKSVTKNVKVLFSMLEATEHYEILVPFVPFNISNASM